MKPDDSNINATTLLDKIRRLYPYGVPDSVVVKPASLQARPPAPQCLLLVVTQVKRELVSTEQALVDGLFSRGLCLAPGTWASEVLSVEEYSSRLVSERVEAYGPKAVIVLGAGNQPDEASIEVGSRVGSPDAAENRCAVLMSYPLEQIANDSSAKREFWKQLQERVLPALRGA